MLPESTKNLDNQLHQQEVMTVFPILGKQGHRTMCQV